jgi:hypothetical protein
LLLLDGRSQQAKGFGQGLLVQGRGTGARISKARPRELVEVGLRQRLKEGFIEIVAFYQTRL